MAAISKHGRIAHQGPALIGERVRSLSERVAKTILRRWRIASIVAELEAFSDRELNDMGIARHDIRHVARQAVNGA